MQPNDSQWRKSSYSSGTRTCVEVAHPGWQKSSYSKADRTCVEIAPIDHSVAARDSKDPDGGYLLVSPSAWSSFLGGIRGGRFERS
ncbi:MULTISPECIES: DUF397 domain-containing protein [unclassified Saccharopolyspora]|uniref:DUF397 domain-containing protein n=1 Tax=Saccharopolyspora TaxID=1835 RepID=UPI00190DC290|nr:DUF397 domain-containing protein [Saccharopolyspora sp. HNM0986]MBK0867119.1 DUF397 domain-containing protein [Saccharopolyspora sp. HNM0986]